MMRRTLAIDEQSYGPDHPDVAIQLNNLANLLCALDRVGEAEPLSRRMAGIFLDFTRRTGHEHPHQRGPLGNYAGLLKSMGLSEPEVRQRLNALLAEYGMSLAHRPRRPGLNGPGAGTTAGRRPPLAKACLREDASGSRHARECRSGE